MQAVQDANDRLRQMLRAMVTTKQPRSGLSSPQSSHQHQGRCHRAGGCSPAKGAQGHHGGKAVRVHARKVAAAGQHQCQHHHHCCHPAPCRCKAHRWQSQHCVSCRYSCLSCIYPSSLACSKTTHVFAAPSSWHQSSQVVHLLPCAVQSALKLDYVWSAMSSALPQFCIKSSVECHNEARQSKSKAWT